MRCDCRTHFVEYLTALIRKNKIDPVVIFDLAEVLQEFRRRGKSLPIRPANMFEHEYRRLCIKVRKLHLKILTFFVKISILIIHSAMYRLVEIYNFNKLALNGLIKILYL